MWGPSGRREPLANFQTAFHAFFPVARKEEQLLVAIKGEEPRLHRRKTNGQSFARSHVLLNGETGGCVLQDKIMRGEKCDAREREFNGFAGLDNKMLRVIRITIHGDG